MQFGLLPQLRPREGGKMCFLHGFLCGRLAAEDWWHAAHVLTPDPQVEAHVCVRRAQLAGSDIAT